MTPAELAHFVEVECPRRVREGQKQLRTLLKLIADQKNKPPSDFRVGAAV